MQPSESVAVSLFAFFQAVAGATVGAGGFAGLADIDVHARMHAPKRCLGTRAVHGQVGVRDETKIVGGIGICGRPLCCHSYLSEFIPVSIKMAKEQNLSLNPTKISGVCGRLMCCLKNEEETYEDLNSKLPNVGDYVTTDDGLKGEVHSVSVLRQLVKVIVITKDEKEIREYRVDQLKFKPRRRKDKGSVADAELKALEALEKKEGKSKLDDN